MRSHITLAREELVVVVCQVVLSPLGMQIQFSMASNLIFLLLQVPSREPSMIFLHLRLHTLGAKLDFHHLCHSSAFLSFDMHICHPAAFKDGGVKQEVRERQQRGLSEVSKKRS
jgi:hypothetical protein